MHRIQNSFIKLERFQYHGLKNVVFPKIFLKTKLHFQFGGKIKRDLKTKSDINPFQTIISTKIISIHFGYFGFGEEYEFSYKLYA